MFKESSKDENEKKEGLLASFFINKGKGECGQRG
jgi:hypothetical protein